jgi:hypothetical protein
MWLCNQDASQLDTQRMKKKIGPNIVPSCLALGCPAVDLVVRGLGSSNDNNSKLRFLE